MGLFERLRVLVGGDGGDRAAIEDDDSRTASPPTEPRSARPPGDGDRRHQGHASHWDALLPPARRDRGIETVVDAVLDEGEQVPGEPLGDAEVVGHRHDEGALGALVVCEDGEVATAYPVADGVDHAMTLDACNEWGSELEAWVGGTLREHPLTLFPTNYFQHPLGRFEGDATASLAVWMYELSPAEYETVVDDDGEEVDVGGIAGYRPYERGAPDDVVLRTTVEAVDAVSYLELPAYRIRAPLFRTDDGEAVEVAIYAGEHAVEEPPAVGDDVEGAGWVQAWVK